MHTFFSFSSHLLHTFFRPSSSAVSSNFKKILEFNIPEYSRIYNNIYHSCRFLYKSLQVYNMAICNVILIWQIMPYFFNVNLKTKMYQLWKPYQPKKKNPNHSFPYDKLNKYIRKDRSTKKLKKHWELYINKPFHSNISSFLKTKKTHYHYLFLTSLFVFINNPAFVAKKPVSLTPR